MLLFDLVPMRVIPPVFFAIFTYWLVGLHTQCIFCIFQFIGRYRPYMSVWPLVGTISCRGCLSSMLCMSYASKPTAGLRLSLAS